MNSPFALAKIFALTTAMISIAACTSMPSHEADREASREPASTAGGAPALFQSHEPLALKLRSDFAVFFANVFKALEAGDATGAKEISTDAELSYFDPQLGREVSLALKLKPRGHTSLSKEECPFPKLDAKVVDKKQTKGTIFAGVKKFKIGTHCGELADDQPTFKGRLANEKSPLREAFVYQALEALDVPAQKARAADITYLDGASTLTRHAMLLEDLDAAAERLGGTALKYAAPEEGMGAMEDGEGMADGGPAGAPEAVLQPPPIFTDAVDEKVDLEELASVFLANALVNNYDWDVRVSQAEQTFSSLWNTKVMQLPDGRKLVLPQDFDLATTVSGRVERSPDFPPSSAFSGDTSALTNYAFMHLSRMSRAFTPEKLRAVGSRFRQKVPLLLAALEKSTLDAKGKALFAAHVKRLDTALAKLPGYPTVVAAATQYYLDPELKTDCEAEEIPVGTPVLVAEIKGGSARVIAAEAHQLFACGDRDLWIKADAVSK